jgi:tetratricopeptide (TPR) repeat protein
MGTDDPVKFGLAAHEYAHLALRAWNVQLPPWLNEGVAEFFATLRVTEHSTALGGAQPGRVQTLENHTWMPVADVLSVTEESRGHEERRAANLFYSESWALTQMLLLSKDYAPGFKNFAAMIRSGSPGLEALQATYGKSAEDITRDLHAWLARRVSQTLQLPEVVAKSGPVQVDDVHPHALRLLLAQVLLAAGEFDRAEPLLSALRREEPDSGAVSAALGVIALHKGDSDGALRFWKRAMDQGITDAPLCLRYAILADQAGLPAADIRPALERAIALQPDFDDAHYQLALLEKNDRHYLAAVREFHAMRVVSNTRAYAYWLALADTFNELGQRDEALAAARQAGEHAATAAERARAGEETYIAQTEPSVQFVRDASGHSQLVTTRMPRQQSDWNPFIEPSDDIQHVRGTLRDIECGSVTVLRVEVAGKLVTLAIPDLQHVQMRHAPPEFVCGPQTTTQVTVDYARTPGAATDGLVRGMDF